MSENSLCIEEKISGHGNWSTDNCELWQCVGHDVF